MPANAMPENAVPQDTTPGETDSEMSQQEQAVLLTEPSFTNHLDDEAALLAAEFGPADAAGFFGRAPQGGDGS
jgi:hypothetical protein